MDKKTLHTKAVEQLDKIQTSQKDEREQCLSDRRFYSIAGAQWEGDLADAYENRTKLEINKIHLAVMRIINEYRNNRITVDFTSKDGGVDQDDLSSTLDGLFRADASECNADEAFDNAFEEAVGGGFGAWRLRAVYEDEFDDEDDRQRIVIEPIFDADSTVFFDLGAKRQDKRDASFCFVMTKMTHDEFRDTYDKEPTTIQKQVSDTFFDWYESEYVYVAEYYVVNMTSKKCYIFADEDGNEEKYYEDELEDEELKISLEVAGMKQIKDRKIKHREVRKYIMDGEEILEDCGVIAGDLIPIVPMYGKRWYVDGIERCMGHVRLSRDSQILKNIQISKLAEISSLSPIEKPIMAAEQIAGFETYWEEDNVKNYPFLPVNLIETSQGQAITGVLGYTKPPSVPPALASLLGLTEQDMKELLGNDQALEQVNMNLSGEAIGKLQDRLDMQTYIYISNMSKAMQTTGEVWLSMAKDLYVEDNRDMKIVKANEDTSNVKLNMPAINEETGETVYKNDITKSKMLVNVDVGASTATKKQATIRHLITALQATTDPATQGIISSLVMMNMEGEGMKDVSNYFRKQLLIQGVLEPTEDEQQMLQELQAQQAGQPNPQDQYLAAEAQKAQAQSQKAQADTIKAAAETEKIKAQTAETLAGIEASQRGQTLKEVESFVKAQESDRNFQFQMNNPRPQ